MNKFPKLSHASGTHSGLKSLPPLSHRREFSSPSTSHRLSDAGIFAYVSESKKQAIDASKAAHRFFRHDHNATAITSRLSEEIVLKNQESPLKASRLNHNWELTERFEAYELKTMKTSFEPRSMSLIVSQCALWDACFSELVPILSKRSPDTADIMQKVHANVQSLFNELKGLYDKTQAKAQKKALKMQQKMNSLEMQVLKLQGASEEMLRVKKTEDAKIAKEIEELFADVEGEFQNVMKKNNTLQDLQPTGATEILRQLYDDMSKDRQMPESKDLDLDVMKPEEMENGIMQNFANIQKSTATRVFKLMENRITKASIKVQTEEELVSKQIWEDAQEQAEKLSRLNQGLNQQLESLREDFNLKITQVDKIESEKKEISILLNKSQREVEQNLREGNHFRNESNQLKEQKERMEKEIENNLKEITRLDNKNDEHEEKIRTQAEVIEKYTGLISAKEARIEELNKQLLERKPKIKKVNEDDVPSPPVTETKPKVVKKNVEKDDWEMGMVDIDFMDSSKKKKKPTPRHIIKKPLEIEETNEKVDEIPEESQKHESLELDENPQDKIQNAKQVSPKPTKKHKNAANSQKKGNLKPEKPTNKAKTKQSPKETDKNTSSANNTEIKEEVSPREEKPSHKKEHSPEKTIKKVEKYRPKDEESKTISKETRSKQKLENNKSNNQIQKDEADSRDTKYKHKLEQKKPDNQIQEKETPKNNSPKKSRSPKQADETKHSKSPSTSHHIIENDSYPTKPKDSTHNNFRHKTISKNETMKQIQNETMKQIQAENSSPTEAQDKETSTQMMPKHPEPRKAKYLETPKMNHRKTLKQTQKDEEPKEQESIEIQFEKSSDVHSELSNSDDQIEDSDRDSKSEIQETSEKHSTSNPQLEISFSKSDVSLENQISYSIAPSSESNRYPSTQKLPEISIQESVQIPRITNPVSPLRQRPGIRQMLPIGKKYTDKLPPEINARYEPPLPHKVNRAVSPIVFTETEDENKNKNKQLNLENPPAKEQQSTMVDKEVTTDIEELKVNFNTRSIGTYFNFEKPSTEVVDSGDSSSTSVYFLPFNPNNIYGLKGDNYYRGGVFQAQPKIPDDPESFIFKRYR